MYIKFYLRDIFNKLIIKGKTLLLRIKQGKHIFRTNVAFDDIINV